MKIVIVLCAVMTIALAAGGCAEQNPTATANSHARALADAHTVGSVYGGPAPGHIKQRFEP